jgi:hypothetical protein
MEERKIEYAFAHGDIRPHATKPNTTQVFCLCNGVCKRKGGKWIGYSTVRMHERNDLKENEGLGMKDVIPPDAETAAAEAEFILGVGEMAAEYPNCSQGLITKVLQLGRALSIRILQEKTAGHNSSIPKSYRQLYKLCEERGMSSLSLYLVCQGVMNANGKLTRKFSRERPVPKVCVPIAHYCTVCVLLVLTFF